MKSPENTSKMDEKSIQTRMTHKGKSLNADTWIGWILLYYFLLFLF